VAPTSIVALNRAVALAEVRRPGGRPGPRPRRSTSDGYHLFHATRGDFLRRLDRRDEAAVAFERAAALATNDTERAFLDARRREVTADPS